MPRALPDSPTRFPDDLSSSWTPVRKLFAPWLIVVNFPYERKTAHRV